MQHSNPRRTTVDLFFRQHTATGLQVEFSLEESAPHSRGPIFLPTSQISFDIQDGEVCKVEMPVWLAEKEGLI